MGDFKKWRDPSNGEMILKWGINTPLRTMKLFLIIGFLLALYMSLKRDDSAQQENLLYSPSQRLGETRQEYFSERRKRAVKINSDCYFLVFICAVLILLKYISIYLVLI